jgi:hypothetical protein
MKNLSSISKTNQMFKRRYNTRKRLQWKSRIPIDMALTSESNNDSAYRLRIISSSFRINHFRENCLYKHYNQFVRVSRKTHEKLPGLNIYPKKGLNFKRHSLR